MHVVLLPLLDFSACLPIPHRHLRQPAAHFQVQDEQGQPVAGALVHLYGGYVVGRQVNFHSTATADSLGRAAFSARHELHPFLMLAPDGEAPWRWAWCAEAAGYQREAAAMVAPPRGPVPVRLRPAAGASPCDPSPRTLYEVKAQGNAPPGPR